MNSSPPPKTTTTTTTTTTATTDKDIKEETFQDDLDTTNDNNSNNDINNNNSNSNNDNSNNNNSNNNNSNNNSIDDKSLPSIRDYSLDKIKNIEEEIENNITRFAPYGGSNKKALNFQERLETVELVVSMFPLLEKDANVYKILDRYGWNVEASINELQKRHDYAEKSVLTTGTASFPQDDSTSTSTSTTSLYSTPKVDNNSTEMKILNKHNNGRRYKGIYSHPTNIQDDYDRMDDLAEDEEDGEEDVFEEDLSFEKNITQDLMEVKDNSNNNNNNNNNNSNGNNSKQSAMEFSRFPSFKQDIQTLRDIFGTSFHEYELKGFYMVCNGNLELVIDQLVSEQKQKDTPQKQQAPQPPQPRQPLTAKLSEEEKRQLQLQLIEEQEKLEKKFSDKKQQEINSHPSKKNFSQQEIVNELKDLFSRHVEEGVIEWVAYSCDYDLGKATTQLVDLKHSNLLKKKEAAALAAGNNSTLSTSNDNNNNNNTLNGMQLDPSVQAQIENNLNILSKNLMGLNPNSDNNDSSSTTTNNNNSNNNNNNNNNSFLNNKSIFNTSNLSPPTTTTTTTTTTSTNDQNSSSSTPIFQQNFVYEKK